MPNKVRGESEFLAGTERYIMKLTLGALAEIENGLGVSSLNDISSKLKSLGTMDLATVASALLRGAGHNIAPAEVLKLDTDLGTLIGAIADAFDAVGLGGAKESSASFAPPRDGSSPAQRGSGTAEGGGGGASPLAGTSSSPSP